MDRSRLLELAPQYYVLAFCNYFSKPIHEVASANTLWNEVPNVKNSPLFWYALRALVEKGVLEAFPDDFGPTLYKKTDRFDREWEALQRQPRTPAFKFAMDPNRDQWLYSALEAVNKACSEHKIQDKDFTNPTAEWEPIPVDRADPKVQRVTEALEKTIEEVRGDNGYAATMPEEKAFVMDSLKSASEKLKTDNTISYAYIKRQAIDALDILIRRFGGASVGLAAQAARAAIFDWLKGIGGQILHWLF